MPLTLTCTCGKALHVDEQHRGKKAKCPSCGAVLPIPDAAGLADAPAKRADAGPARSMAPWILAAVAGLFTLFACLVSIGSGAWFYSARVVAEKTREAAVLEKERETQQRRADLRASANNLRQIVIAVHMHHDITKRFPDYATIDPKTLRLGLSWRVLLLPYLDQRGLYEQIRLHEPWDSEHNRQFWTKMPRVYQLPGKANDGKTYYQMYFGNQALYSNAWNPQPRPHFERNAFVIPGCQFTLGNIGDGTSNTIFAVESRDGVNWMKPQDLPFQVDFPNTLVNLAGKHWDDDTFHAAMCDGSVTRLRRTIPPHVLRDLINPNDGNAHDRAPWEVRAP